MFSWSRSFLPAPDHPRMAGPISLAGLSAMFGFSHGISGWSCVTLTCVCCRGRLLLFCACRNHLSRRFKVGGCDPPTRLERLPSRRTFAGGGVCGRVTAGGCKRQKQRSSSRISTEIVEVCRCAIKEKPGRRHCKLATRRRQSGYSEYRPQHRHDQASGPKLRTTEMQKFAPGVTQQAHARISPVAVSVANDWSATQSSREHTIIARTPCGQPACLCLGVPD